MREHLRFFLEESTAIIARSFRGLIVVLILLSSLFAIAQLLEPDIFGHFSGAIESFEVVVLAIFTVEFLLRWFATTSQRQFWNSATTWIDLIAIVPFYFGVTNGVVLRLFRVFRIFRLSRRSMLQFFDEPRSKAALITRFLIVVLIIVSASLALAQLLWPEIVNPYEQQIEWFEYIALAVFTIELFARLFASTSLTGFFQRPTNWIDFLAVAPFYVGIESAVILRVFRILRLFKLVNSFTILNSTSVFDFKNSILRVVTPLIIIFAFLKTFIWMLEDRAWWFVETDFGTLFTIIGFSLGVVLSQKIGRAYIKYLSVQDGLYSLHGKLMSLQSNLNLMSERAGDKIVYTWLKNFMEIYHAEQDGALAKVRENNRVMYDEAAKIGNTEHIPFHRLAAMMSSVFELAVVIQSKRTNRTPVTYNLLLQQTIIMYLLLLVVFIPGAKGMISVIFAGYLLYGLFQITDDFDHVAGSDNENNLIVVDAKRISNYLAELEGLNKAV